MTIYNSSDVVASVGINTLDSSISSGQLSDTTAVTAGSQAGWHDVSLANDIKITSNVPQTHGEKSVSPESVPPFIWSGSSSTKVQLEPLSSTEIPLQICVFSPGIYDLSNYVLNWNILPVNDQGNLEETRQSSGTSPGHPYYLTVLQSDWHLDLCLASFLQCQIKDVDCSGFCNFGL